MEPTMVERYQQLSTGARDGPVPHLPERQQVAEVKRRLADPNPTFLTLEQVRSVSRNGEHEGHYPRGRV
jgi:hypothetical protein